MKPAVPTRFSQDALSTKWKAAFPGGLRFLSYRITSAVPCAIAPDPAATVLVHSSEQCIRYPSRLCPISRYGGCSMHSTAHVQGLWLTRACCLIPRVRIVW